MTLQQLKERIIKDETQFINDLYDDETLSKDEYLERVETLVEEVNACDSPNDLVYFYMAQGCSERDANEQLYSYLIKK